MKFRRPEFLRRQTVVPFSVSSKGFFLNFSLEVYRLESITCKTISYLCEFYATVLSVSCNFLGYYFIKYLLNFDNVATAICTPAIADFSSILRLRNLFWQNREQSMSFF